MSLVDLKQLLQRPAADSKRKDRGTGPCPVRLEVNRTGLWHTVVEFDARDELAEHAVREGCAFLASVDMSVAFRIVMVNGLGVLMNYSNKHGWTPGKGA